MPITAKPKLYNPRHPERTLLYQMVAEHYETWLELASAGQFDGQGDHHTPKPFVRKAFAKYLECGIFAHGFARARCGDCGHDYFVAFSCKGRGVCPSCTTRRMVETAAHLSDHVFPRLPVRQWVLSVPKRLRYFMQRDGAVLSMVLRIFLRVIAQTLQTHSPGAAHMDKAGLHIGAIAFIHRFGSSLNEHVHFHVCVVDGVFEEVEGEGDADATPRISSPGVIFHAATGIDAATVAPVQTTLQKRILRAFVARGLLENCDAKDMLGYKHSGFSVDAGVCIEAHDRAALERLLRYCARPPFSMERLRKEGSKLVYRCAKQRSEPTSDKRGAKADELHLTPLELIDRIAAALRAPRYPLSQRRTVPARRLQRLHELNQRPRPLLRPRRLHPLERHAVQLHSDRRPAILVTTSQHLFALTPPTSPTTRRPAATPSSPLLSTASRRRQSRNDARSRARRYRALPAPLPVWSDTV